MGTRWAGFGSSMLFLPLFVSTVSRAQIPNGDFEQRLTCQCDPPFWTTSDFYINGDPIFLNVWQGTPAHSGRFALYGRVDTMRNGTLMTPNASSLPFPVHVRVDSLIGYYQCGPIGSDHFSVSATFMGNGLVLGTAVFLDSITESTYHRFSAPVVYRGNGLPDQGRVVISIAARDSSGKVHVGSLFAVDDLGFTTVDDVQSFTRHTPELGLEQNYPNPFNPQTTIRFSIPRSSSVTLAIIDLLGKEVARLINGELPAGIHEVAFNAPGLASGVYFCRLEAEHAFRVKVLVLAK